MNSTISYFIRFLIVVLTLTIMAQTVLSQSTDKALKGKKVIFVWGGWDKTV
jgi:hypothetical protein